MGKRRRKNALTASWVIKTILTTLINPLVVVTIVTIAGLIVGILTYVSPQQPSTLTISFCVFVGVIGLLAVCSQVRQIYKNMAARSSLGALIDEGHRLIKDIPESQKLHEASPALAKKVQDWFERIERAIQTYLDDATLASYKVRTSEEETYTIGNRIAQRLAVLAKIIEGMKE